MTAATAAAPAGDLGAVLAVLREHAVALAASGPQPPSRIRVEAGGIVVELDWPGSAVPGSAVPGSPVGGGAVPAAAAPVAPVPELLAHNGTVAPAGHRLTAPTVGVFYRSPEPGAPPFVGEGDPVAAGQQVAIVEAMKLMIPVEADRAGRVAAILCDDGTSVEYGQPLFALVDA